MRRIGNGIAMAVSAIILCFFGAAVTSVHAGLVNDVPSCYAATHIRPQNEPYSHLVYILMDQTAQLPPSLEQSAVNNTLRMLRPGTKFVITEFSAFSQGHFLRVLHTGIIERPLPKSRVDSTPISATQNLNACLADQMGFARRMVATTMAQVMKNSTSSLDQSDIMLAFKAVSGVIARDPARHKVVFAITDGLENSGVTTFYGGGGVRVIHPAHEMALAAANHLFGNFGGASVYVLGGAVMPPARHGPLAQTNGYRDPQVLMHLKEFWKEYFRKSNAHLREFGEPGLVSPVSYAVTSN